MRRAVSIISEGDTTEIQWGSHEPVDGIIDGYVLVHADGMLTVPFRDDNDNAFVFVLDGDNSGGRILATEDQPPAADAPVVWSGTEFDPKGLREIAHREYEIARLMGASDENEFAWQDYLASLVKLSDDYLARTSS